jgi:hypothetical protein
MATESRSTVGAGATKKVPHLRPKDRDLMEGVGYSGGIQSGAMVCSLLNMWFSDPITTQRPLASEQEADAAAGFTRSLSRSTGVIIGNEGLGERGLRNSPRMRSATGSPEPEQCWCDVDASRRGPRESATFFHRQSWALAMRR